MAIKDGDICNPLAFTSNKTQKIPQNWAKKQTTLLALLAFNEGLGWLQCILKPHGMPSLKGNSTGLGHWRRSKAKLPINNAKLKIRNRLLIDSRP